MSSKHRGASAPAPRRAFLTAVRGLYADSGSCILRRKMMRRANSLFTPDANDWFWVRDAAATRFLLNPTTRPYYMIFLQEPLDLHEAAARLDLKRTTLRYHVQRLVQWELLTPLTISTGRGRLRFKAVHPRLFLPFETSGYATLDDLLLQMHGPLLETFMRQVVLAGHRGAPHALHRGGVTLSRESVDFSLTPPPDVTTQETVDLSVWSSWTTLALTPLQAQVLKGELAAVWQRFHQQAAPGPGTSDYTLLLGLAPELK